jgi:hypothetical protein
MVKSLNVYKSRKDLIVDNFLGGIAWGVGSAVGALFLLSLLSYILTKLQYVPFVGEVVKTIGEQIQNTR